MTDIHAAIGRVQLKKLPEWTRIRQANARYLDSALSNVIIPKVADGATHVYHQYTIRCDNRDEFARQLNKKNIGNGVYYPTPVHRLPSFASNLDLPETEAAAASVLSLPVHPSLNEKDLEDIVKACQ